MVDVPGNSTTTATITPGTTVTGSLETKGDHDWYAIHLTAGQTITIYLNGAGTYSLEDPYVYIRSSSGTLLADNDDATPGNNRNSHLTFTATTTGTYYIDVGAWNNNYTGTYELSINSLPVYSIDQAATQLTHGYWDNGDWRAFDVDPGGTITVNIMNLTPDGQALARAALAAWTDVIGINFVETTGTAQITFDDEESGAHAESTVIGNVITSSVINVSKNWLNTYGTSLNSYSFQTYMHEIGHALGLGHAGDYNGSATYPKDAIYLNDAWPISIMSYFSPEENSYFGSQGFTDEYVMTPMLADIVAMQTLYGASTTTRTGNTTYGFNSNAGNVVFNANQYPGARYTIVDSGGTDTLDYSGHFQAQLINLNQDTFSNIGGKIGNVSIGRGTIIENAIGGSGNDTLIGNSANNILNGGGGNDIVSYAAATAGVTVDLRITTSQNTVGAGWDTLLNFEQITGSAFADTLTGGTATTSIRGGAGNDTISGGSAGNFTMYGEGGDDTLLARTGDDSFNGGEGFDTIDYSSATSGVTVTTDSTMHTGGSGFDSLTSVERVIGSGFNDVLVAFGAGHAAVGGGGNDTLTGSTFGASQLQGGAGNDSYQIDSADDVIIEAAGEGTDSVSSTVSHTLSANVENLTLGGSGAINGTGNAVDNVLTGNGNANALTGLGGNDTLMGAAGDDILDGGDGDDTLHGGDGNDTASYAASSAGVTVSLSIVGAQATGGAGSDTLTSIETLIGSAFADSLTGNASANVLNGGGGDDLLFGGAGADTLTGGSGGDRFHFNSDPASGADQITDFGAGDGIYLDRSVFTAVATGTLAASAFGLGSSATTAEQRIVYNSATGQILYDSDGSGSSAAVLIAKVTPGTSLSASSFVAYGGASPVTVQSSGSYTLTDSEQHLVLTGTSAINGTGNGFANDLSGNSAANILSGLGGNDRLFGFGGNDTLDGGADDDLLDGGDGNDTASYAAASAGVQVSLATAGAQATGGAGSDTLAAVENLTGSAFDDVLTGDSGANLLSGGGGADTLEGGGGDDLLDGGAGGDTASYAGSGSAVQVSLSIVGAQATGGAGSDTLVGIENLTGSTFGDVLTGNASANVIDGGAGDDFLYGGAGADTLIGGAGADRFHFDAALGSGADQIGDFQAGDSIHLDGTVFGGLEDGALGDSAFAQGSAATTAEQRIVYDSATGQIFYDSDGSGANAAILFATVTPGTTLSASSFIVYNGIQPAITIESAVSYTLVDPESNLVLTGADAINGTGNALGNSIAGNGAANVLSGLGGNDTLSGNGGNDTLDGGAGDDSLDGGDGSDTATYATAAAAVAVSLAVSAAQATGGGGTDTLVNIENLTGSAFNDVLTGNALANVLTGGAGNDTLDGGAGADSMSGGTGDDVYMVDVATDSTIELAGEGIDTVISSVAHTLKVNVENLTLTGSGPLSGNGNTLANVITGNNGANRLSGQSGNDTLIGNGGNDTLDGGTGSDTMTGGAGNDTYMVDNSGDVVIEQAGQGSDTVRSSISYTLGANVENLVLSGRFGGGFGGGGFGGGGFGGGGFGGSIDGTGNELANRITGSTGANILSGLAGNDTLVGGGGNDTLYGGDGNDTIEGGAGYDQLFGGTGADRFLFRGADVNSTSQTSHDIIQDFSSLDGDRIALDMIDANSTVAGNQAFAFLGNADFTGTAGELRYEQIGGQTFVQGDTNGDGTADFWIAVTGSHNFAGSDFVL